MGSWRIWDDFDWKHMRRSVQLGISGKCSVQQGERLAAVKTNGLKVSDSNAAGWSLRPVFKETVVYLTGGFRTAPAMVSAVLDGTTDGIGLGRPITAEPDLPAKILRGECLSAPDAKVNQDDYMITSTASNMQMGQMSKQPSKDLKTICDGIADLSHPEEAENFKKASAVYFDHMKEIAERNEAIHGVMEYNNIVS
ncbi:hypothetical protein COOONC_14656 [Cooperia oncophora]